MILNPKHLNPRDETTPRVIQVETAMGSAIYLFPGAAVVRVPQSRMIPVKTTGDLLALRSDCYLCEPDQCIFPNPDRRKAGFMDRVDIRLDDRYYKKVDDFESRFPQSVPSLVYCESFEVIGDVRFENNITAEGRVTVINNGKKQAVVKSGSRLKGEVALA